MSLRIVVRVVEFLVCNFVFVCIKGIVDSFVLKDIISLRLLTCFVIFAVIVVRTSKVEQWTSLIFYQFSIYFSRKKS